MEIIKNEIITIYKTEKGTLIDARELHDFLEIEEYFRIWMKDIIKKYEFIENEDFIIFTNNRENLGDYLKTEYVITINTAKEISLVQNDEKGLEARKYFRAVEKKLKE